jgi:hypothetical protein
VKEPGDELRFEFAAAVAAGTFFPSDVKEPGDELRFEFAAAGAAGTYSFLPK